MPLDVGSRLGHYDVTALIGEGGMGQVYRATDTKLKRQVALKILPEAFSADPERLARFQREAEVLASLNHPNIAAIHGLEESEGTRALVLELVEEPTLADRISRGPIPPGRSAANSQALVRRLSESGALVLPSPGSAAFHPSTLQRLHRRVSGTMMSSSSSTSHEVLVRRNDHDRRCSGTPTTS